MSEYETSDSESEGFNSEKYNVNKNACVLLVDSSPPMFDDRRLFKLVMQACYDVFDKNFLKNYTKNFAICVMREDSCIIKPPDEDIIITMKKLRKYIGMSDDGIRKQFEQKGSFSLSRIMTSCKTIFYDMKNVNPHFVVVTASSNPCAGLSYVSNEIANLMDVGQSMRDARIKLYVLPLVQDFAYDHVYGELLSTVNDVPRDSIDPSEVYKKSDEITDILVQLTNTRRHLKRTLFYFADDHHMYIQVKKFTRKNKSLTFTYFDRENVQEVAKTKPKAKYDAVRLGAGVTPLTLEKDALDKLRNLSNCNVGLTLLYVTDDRADIHLAIKGSFIVQIDEKIATNKGNQVLFNYIWDYCDKKNKVLVCLYVVLSGRNCPRIVQLKPNTHQGKPAFFVSYLPFRDSTKLNQTYKYYEKPAHENNLPEDLVKLCADAMQHLLMDINALNHLESHTHFKRLTTIKNYIFDFENRYPCSFVVPSKVIQLSMLTQGLELRAAMKDRYGDLFYGQAEKRTNKQAAEEGETSSGKRAHLASRMK